MNTNGLPQWRVCSKCGRREFALGDGWHYEVTPGRESIELCPGCREVGLRLAAEIAASHLAERALAGAKQIKLQIHVEPDGSGALVVSEEAGATIHIGWERAEIAFDVHAAGWSGEVTLDELMAAMAATKESR